MKGIRFMKLSKFKILAYFFFILQIFLYIVNAENYSQLFLQLNSNNPDLSPASNTGRYIGTFIALTFFFAPLNYPKLTLTKDLSFSYSFLFLFSFLPICKILAF